MDKRLPHIASDPDAPGLRAMMDRPPDVGGNLREFRRRAGLSLETLAKQSGVSRAMLGQIETGRSVPTVTLLWRIARALGIAICDLVGEASVARAQLLVHPKLNSTGPDGRGYAAREYLRPQLALPFDVSEIRVSAGHCEAFTATRSGRPATLVLHSGRLDIRTDEGSIYLLSAGDALLFDAGRAHEFSNSGSDAAIACLVVARAQNIIC